MVYRQGSPDPTSSEIVFFLGAGASVNAGIPTTYLFVDEYLKSITDSSKKETITKIISILKAWKGEEIDIELLLETLTKLQDKSQDPLLPFFSGGKFLLDGYSEKEPIIDDLKNFIKSKAIVESEEKIRYLQPFLEFTEEFHPLDIISVNYDTCIEQFCNYYRLFYQDGFDVNWNPSVFENPHTNIRLFKIHGSVMWYQSDRAGYIKLPVMTRESKIQLISGESAENLMLYPMKKWDFAEPLLELLVKTKHLLESESCKFLIVVGYSFRDDHIKRLLLDAARKNRNLIVILIDPNARNSYLKHLKFYNSENSIPSALSGRVVCLPYCFEKVFPFLKNWYLKNLADGLSFESSQKKIELSGEKPFWLSCIQAYADADYTEKVHALLTKESIDPEKYWSISLEVYVKMAVSLIAQGDVDHGLSYFVQFCERMKILTINRLKVEYAVITSIIGSHQMIFKFNHYLDTTKNFPYPESYAGPQEFQNTIIPLLNFLQMRMGFLQSSNEELLKLFETLRFLNLYFESIQKMPISIQDYIHIRKDSQNIRLVIDKFELWKTNDFARKYADDINAAVRENEASILESILFGDKKLLV